MNWTNEQIDAVLEKLLPLNSKREYERQLVWLSQEIEVGAADILIGGQVVRDGDPINRALWGLCLRLRGYVGPVCLGSRTARCGPFSWVEHKMLQWALFGKSDQQKAKPDAEYMAVLFQRDIKEVNKEMNRLGPARGRRGFFDGERTPGAKKK